MPPDRTDYPAYSGPPNPRVRKWTIVFVVVAIALGALALAVAMDVAGPKEEFCVVSYEFGAEGWSRSPSHPPPTEYPVCGDVCRRLQLIHDADPMSSDAKTAKKDAAKKWGCAWAI